MKREKNNNHYKPGQIIHVRIKGQRNLVRCRVESQVKPGYTKLEVTDQDQDTWVRTSPTKWSWRLKRNHARNQEYLIHIDQIEEAQDQEPTPAPWPENN